MSLRKAFGYVAATVGLVTLAYAVSLCAPKAFAPARTTLQISDRVQQACTGKGSTAGVPLILIGLQAYFEYFTLYDGKRVDYVISAVIKDNEKILSTVTSGVALPDPKGDILQSQFAIQFPVRKAGEYFVEVALFTPKSYNPPLEYGFSDGNPFAAFLPAHWNEVSAAKTFNLSPLECSVADANG